MRVLFAGTPSVAVCALRELAAHHEVVGVITRPDAPGRRGKTLHPSPVAKAAEELGIAVLKTTQVNTNEAREFITGARADVAAVVAYGALLPADALQLVPNGWVNLHFSLLPAFRGAAPVQRMIQAQEPDFGVSIFQIDQGLDTGPLLAQRRFDVGTHPTAGEALCVLAEQSAPYFSKILAEFVAGQITPTPQVDKGASYAARLTKAEGEVDFTKPAAVVDAHIRAFTPAPGAWSTAGSLRVKILAAHLATNPPSLAPGAAELVGNELVVGCAKGAVILDQVAPAGKKPMPAAAWWRGYRGPAQLGPTR